MPILRGLAFTLGAWAVGAGALRVFVIPAEHCPPVDLGSVRASAAAAAQWLVRSQSADGSYVYEYDVARNRDLGGYNEVRHAGVTMSLYQAAAEGFDGDIAAADRAMERMIENLIEHEDWVALKEASTGQVKLGSSALMLAGLAHRRIATGDPAHDGLMRALARFIVRMQEPDGAMLGFWDERAGAPVPASYSQYYTGEAFWALTLMHRLFPGEGWDAPARRIADYLALHRDEREGIDYPPWADQWAAYGLAEMARWPGGSEANLEDHHIRYARALAARFGFLVRVESRRTGDGLSKFVHGRQSRAAGTGTWGEGLASLWQIARSDARMAELQRPIADRAICLAGLLVDRQVSPAEAQQFDDPAFAAGAWYRDNVTRMDDQQHALSALALVVPIIEAGHE